MSSVATSSSSDPPRYRVRRKPAPTIDHAEKYPSPDPNDPFAPLWVLRNRTSSALGQNPLVTEASPSPFAHPPNHAKPSLFGANLEATTSNNNIKTTNSSSLNSTLISMERRRSNSYIYTQPSIPPVNAFQVPPRSSSTIPSTTSTGAKLGSHHAHINRPSSQAGYTPIGSGGVFHGGGATQTPPTRLAQAQAQQVKPHSDVTTTLLARTAHLVSPSPRTETNQNEPGPVQVAHPQPRAPGIITRRPTLDRHTPEHSSGADTESERSVVASPPHKQQEPVDVKVNSIDVGKKSSGMTTTVSFNIGVDVKPKLLRRATSNGTSNSIPVSLSGKDSRPQQQQPSRLAKFLLSKKTSHDGYMADGEKKVSRGHARTAVHKASISAPLTETFVHQQGESKAPELKQDQGRLIQVQNSARGAGDYTSDTEAEESTGSSRFRGVRVTKGLFRQPPRKMTSVEDANIRTAALKDAKPVIKQTETVEVVVPPHSAAVKTAEKQQPLPHKADGKKEKHKTEMSWAEVNMEDYYTPAPSPRVSYPTPAPSPEPKPAQELEPEPTVPEKDEQGEKKPVKGKKEKPEISSPDMPIISKVQEQPTRVRNLRSTKQTVIPISTSISPPIQSSIPVSPSAPAPPPPPKITKRRISGSVPSAAPDTGNQMLPSTQSISNTSIVHVSLISGPTPTPLSEQEEDASAFVRPRRAPKPPGLAGGVSNGGVQSDPEPMKKETKGLKDEKAQAGGRRTTMWASKAMSEDDSHMPIRKPTELGWKTVAKSGSKVPVSALKHGKSSSIDFGFRKNGVAAEVKKPIMTTSASGPVSLPSKEKARPLSPPPSSQLPRSQSPKIKLSADQISQFSSSSLQEYTIPTAPQLLYAASLPVYDEDGRKLLFRTVFEKQKTVVIFLRHFWCPNCQDYMTLVRDVVRPEMLISGGESNEELVWKRSTAKKGGEVKLEMQEKISLVVICNAAHGMIAKYRQMLSLPFKVYTDPTLGVYKALGMGKTDRDCDSTDKLGQSRGTHYHSDSGLPSLAKKTKLNYSLRRKPTKPDTSVSSLSEQSAGGSGGGGYARNGLMSGFAKVVVRAIKVGVPVWEKGGDSGQLGGEFVLGPGLVCSYAHRMQSTKGHAAIEEVLQAAGVRLIREPTPNPPRPTSPLPLAPHAPLEQKKTLGHKQAQSIDLASPPRSRDSHPPITDTGAVRRRTESLRPTPGLNRSSTVPTAPLLSHRVPSQQGNRERKNDALTSSGIPVSNATKMQQIPTTLPSSIKAVLTREEEEVWMAERRKTIEMMQEKKNVKRVGELGRMPGGGSGAPSSSQSASRGYGYPGQAPGKSAVAATTRGEVLMTESRSAPIRLLDEEDRILYKAETRRPQDRTRHHDVHGHGYAQRINTLRR